MRSLAGQRDTAKDDAQRMLKQLLHATGDAAPTAGGEIAATGADNALAFNPRDIRIQRSGLRREACDLTHGEAADALHTQSAARVDAPLESAFTLKRARSLERARPSVRGRPSLRSPTEFGGERDCGGYPVGDAPCRGATQRRAPGGAGTTRRRHACAAAPRGPSRACEDARRGHQVRLQ